MFAKLLARDVLFIGLTALIWTLGASASAVPGPPGDFAGVLAGLTIGISAYLVHEWGHLIGAWFAGSAVQPGRSLASGFLFSFDSRANSRRQFLSLSLGGWIATVLALAFVYGALPGELFASRVARGVVAGNALLVVLLEIPLVVYSLITGRVPPVENQPAAGPLAAAAE